MSMLLLTGYFTLTLSMPRVYCQHQISLSLPLPLFRLSRSPYYHEFRDDYSDCRRTSSTYHPNSKSRQQNCRCWCSPPSNFSHVCSAQPQFTNLQTLQCCIYTTCSRHSSKNLPTHTKPNSTLLNHLILLSGYVSPNPGLRAPKYPCGVCCKAVNWGQGAVKCDERDAW